MNLAAIPAELREVDRWVTWRSEDRGGKATKVPYVAGNPTRHASSTDAETWGSFDEARASYAVGHFDGVGFTLTNTPFAGVDFDDCVVDGRIDPAVEAWLGRLDSYSEISPSGTGVKVFLRAKLDGPGRRTKKTAWGGEVEVYDERRYFATTGDHVTGTPLKVHDRQQVLGEPRGRPVSTRAEGGRAAPDGNRSG